MSFEYFCGVEWWVGGVVWVLARGEPLPCDGEWVGLGRMINSDMGGGFENKLGHGWGILGGRNGNFARIKLDVDIGVIDNVIYAPFVFGTEMGGWKYFDFLTF